MVKEKTLKRRVKAPLSLEYSSEDGDEITTPTVASGQKKKISKGIKLNNNGSLDDDLETRDNTNVDLNEESVGDDNSCSEAENDNGTDDVPVKKNKFEGESLSRRHLTEKRKMDIKNTASRTIFIGNVPLSCRPREIKKLFREFGEIETAYQRSLIRKNEKLTLKMVSTDKTIEKHLSAKIFFVRFKTNKSAIDAAQKMHGYILDGHNLRVTLSNKNELSSVQSIFIGNVSFEAREQEVYDFFTKNCGEVDSVRLIRDKKNGRNTGIGYVAFKDPATILTALNLNGIKFQKRPLRILKLLKKNQKQVKPSNKKKSHFDKLKTDGKIKKMNKNSNANSQKKVENLSEEIIKSSTFVKGDVINKKKKIGIDKKEKKPISKGIRKTIKKREKLKKPRSLMN